MAHWWQSPPGRYLLAWEQAQIDRLVNDVFGFHALQLGLPQLMALRANRMPHRWLALDADGPEDWMPVPLPPVDSSLSTVLPIHRGGALLCDFDALPFPDQSLDLVLMPHTLELARDAHDTLREVERVLMPEGRVVLIGLNPTSLWGLRQRAGQGGRRFGGDGRGFVPQFGEAIGYRRARDWLRLLGLEVARAQFGCWRPPLASAAWLARWRWMDALGARVWPVLGAVYVLEAVKRVRGMRLVGLAPARAGRSARAPAVAAQRMSLAGPTPSANRPETLRRISSAAEAPSTFPEESLK